MASEADPRPNAGAPNPGADASGTHAFPPASPDRRTAAEHRLSPRLVPPAASDAHGDATNAHAAGSGSAGPVSGEGGAVSGEGRAVSAEGRAVSGGAGPASGGAEPSEADTGLDDLALVRAFIDRESGAEEQLTARLAIVPRILRALNGRSRGPLDEHDLADLVQDTLAIILRKLEQFDGRTALDAWLYGICFFELKNAGRRVNRRPRLTDELENEIPDRQSESGPDVDRIADDVRRGLATLGPAERPVVELKHFENLTFDQIGERIGVSPNTAKTRYYRGLTKLKQFMGPRRSEYRGLEGAEQ